MALKPRHLAYSEILIIIILASVPLFVSFPYRVNIFLSWEGAYRISEGQLPFRDFGTPLGGMYWVIPGIFFKIFGPQMISLVKAQVFINILSGLAFRSILKSCKVEPNIRFVSVLLYCLSFSFFNFWPWYNHTVIVYEFLGLACLLKGIHAEKTGPRIAWLAGAAFFSTCSFLTKQDAGAIGILLSGAILLYHSLERKEWKAIAIYVLSLGIIMAIFIVPFLKHGFGYWFNHGQAPHSSRISAGELMDEFFSSSAWLKFYIFLIAILVFVRFSKWKELWHSRTDMIFLLITVGVLGEAAVFQVTSYTPPDNNIFFHSFAIAFILSALVTLSPLRFKTKTLLAVCTAGVLLWWSSVYWKYIQRITERAFPRNEAVVSSTGENIVTRKTFMITEKDTSAAAVPESQWVFSGLNTFNKIYMPAATADGIKRLMQLPVVKNKKPLQVLNMSELTPLAAEIPFELEKGSHYPLWYHLGVGMFNKQAEMFEKNIADNKYDLVLFEYIPSLNNFYPFRVRDSLLVHYTKIDSFPAPRRGETTGMIEVFTRK